ncbi:MAG: glycogen/starch/alpha-glucan phosphorylase [Myxococcales bacterium]|jgi:starch phosphorylase
MTTTANPVRIRVEDDRTGVLPVVLTRAFTDHLQYSQGKPLVTSTAHDRFKSLAYLVRDRLVRRWIETQQAYYDHDVKRVCYLSAEFLLGRALANNLISLGIYNDCKAVLAELGISLDDILEEERDAGLGNGGLGRLAACFLDSLATLGLPGYGYGIRYQFGIFEQVIRNGFQIEKPEEWLKKGNPWEIQRPERAVRVDFYGRSENYLDEHGNWRFRWVDTRSVIGVPYDTPIAGFGNETVNTLRLWEATASEDFDLDVFNDGDYEAAVADKNESEVISKVLYPNDHTVLGKELRLKQQYFFVRCALADIIRRHLATHPSLDNLADKVAIQLNDTHPAVAVVELMRVLIDEHRIDWDKAWNITRATLAYTNHTVLSEALERWSVSLFGRLLPRHMEILFEINRRFLREVLARWSGDLTRIGRMSLIEEGDDKKVRMANLALVGSHSVNGVAALHTEILKNEVFRDFFEMFPERFSNKTNGITPRRWLLQCNPRLASAITDRIGPTWTTNLDRLQDLLPLAEDAAFCASIGAIKRANKGAFADYLHSTLGIRVDPDSMFDVQVKRIHEYKRQLLNVLHGIALYLRARRDPSTVKVPRTFLFAGKAAPGYRMAKLIIKLIGAVGKTIEADTSVHGLAVHFVPNYRVSLAERLIPAAEVSEQISTAGMEASGTGNMKLALNGALTIGTLDGANVEIREAVGADHFFLFGLTTQDVADTTRFGYRARWYYETNAELREVIDLVASGFFSPEEPGLFRPIVDNLLGTDRFRVMADYAEYAECQARIERAYADPKGWNHSSVVNIATVGRFSSDRTIREYAEQIWDAKSVSVVVPPYVSTDPT